MYDTIKYEKQGNIALITINRPEALNALNSKVISELEQAVAAVEADTSLGAMILTGEGRSFVAGADIAEQCPMDPAAGRKWGQRGGAMMRRIELLPIPTIAAVNGFALGGGCELAMSCDIILASEKAKFGQPEVGLGITPGFSGKMIKADEAEKIGLVNAVYAPEELMNGAMEMAKSFAANAPVAVRYAKSCIDRGMQMDMDSAIAYENELFALCFATDDQKEGMTAFLEKREKHFSGK